MLSAPTANANPLEVCVTSQVGNFVCGYVGGKVIDYAAEQTWNHRQQIVHGVASLGDPIPYNSAQLRTRRGR
jgi:hypothetical protein